MILCCLYFCSNRDALLARGQDNNAFDSPSMQDTNDMSVADMRGQQQQIIAGNNDGSDIH